MQYRRVVTAFLRHQGKLLLVRRSRHVGSYQGRWSAISGYLEASDPLEQALREIQEETGLAGERCRLVATGKPIEVPDPALSVCWVVHPFLFEVEEPGDIRLDWENTEWRWVPPEELESLATVPALARAWAAVGGSDGRG